MSQATNCSRHESRTKVRAVAFWLAFCCGVHASASASDIVVAVAASNAEPRDVLLQESTAPTETRVEVQREDLSGKVRAGQSIMVDNPYGDVRLRFGGYQHAVDMHVTLQQPKGAAAIVLKPHEDDGRYLIAPRLPVGAVLEAGQRIDLVVYVPEKHAVSVRTERGSIEARGLKSDLDLKSVDGDIFVRGTVGTVSAETGGGAIEASLEPAQPGSRQRLVTSTGNILIGVNDKLDARLLLATSGVFATEFSLTVSRRPGEEPNKQASTIIGAGNAELMVESRRGEIRLLRRAEFNEVPGEAPSDSSGSGQGR